jgi:hypothetical protein
LFSPNFGALADPPFTNPKSQAAKMTPFDRKKKVDEERKKNKK